MPSCRTSEIRAIEKVGLAKEVHEQKLKEAQEIAEAVLDAEVRIGELTKKTEQAQGARTDLQHGNNAVTKLAYLRNGGFTGTDESIKMQVSRFEQLAAHPETVERAKAEARERGEVISRTAVMRQIAAEAAPDPEQLLSPLYQHPGGARIRKKAGLSLNGTKGR